jgi:thiol:disulfide interchange protein DsbD
MVKSLARGVALAALIAFCGAGLAQTASQIVEWTASVEPAGPLHAGRKAAAAIHAEIKAGWHVYALSQAPGGPTAMTIKLQENPAFAAAGEPTGDAPEKLYDKNFEMDTVLYEHGASFKLPLAVKDSAPAGMAAAKVDVHFQTCNERTCLPPATVYLPLEATIVAAASKAAPTAPAVKSVVKAAAPVVASAPVPVPAPVEVAKVAVPVAASVAVVPANLTAQGFGSFVWLAMAMGALSLLTPCVFPMIPITVSYFANHAGQTRGASVARAGVYAGGIVATFSAFGMLLAVLFGAGGVNRLAANPWVNLFITAIFLAFALSLFGAFFMQVPAGMTQRLDSISRSSGGSLGALLMGVLFSLTSFTCTAPFVGTLLVLATEGNWRWPLAGMVAFSSVFAIPFFVLALAPQMLSTLPRAGSWMNSVKVVMGFLEIAAAMKFLSNADLVFGWGIFTRPVVLSIWVAVGVLVVLYLLGNFTMPHDGPAGPVNATRAVFAIVFLALSIWMATGLAGKGLGELEAFLPPVAPASPGVASTSASPDQPRWIVNDFAAASALAAKENKPIFIDFTGYTCTNCRWMEANIFPRPEIERAMSGFVLARLYTDGDGKVFEAQQRMQNDRFGTVALPLYAILTPDGGILATFPGLTRNPAEFLQFLEKGGKP